MDPKKVSDLDPKLKEVYERVMGTNVSSSKAPAPQSPSKTSESTGAPTGASPRIEQQVEEAPKPQPAPRPAAANVQVFTAKGGVKQTETDGEKKKGGSPVLTIVLVLAGVLFFAIYALFWLRFFNAELPFTLPF